MADNEDDSALEDIPNTNNDEKLDDVEISAEKKKGFSLTKPTIIKIAIGVVIALILAGAAYFFLFNSEEPAADDPDSVDEIVDDTVEAEADVEKAAEELESIDEQLNLDLDTEPELDAKKLDLLGLYGDEEEEEEEEIVEDPEPVAEAKAVEVEKVNMEPAQSNVDTQPEITTEAIDEQAAAEARAKRYAERYKNIYEEDTRGYPWTRAPKNTVPPPDPKWGEFERQ